MRPLAATAPQAQLESVRGMLRSCEEIGADVVIDSLGGAAHYVKGVTNVPTKKKPQRQTEVNMKFSVTAVGADGIRRTAGYCRRLNGGFWVERWAMPDGEEGLGGDDAAADPTAVPDDGVDHTGAHHAGVPLEGMDPEAMAALGYEVGPDLGHVRRLCVALHACLLRLDCSACVCVTRRDDADLTRACCVGCAQGGVEGYHPDGIAEVHDPTAPHHAGGYVEGAEVVTDPFDPSAIASAAAHVVMGVDAPEGAQGGGEVEMAEAHDYAGEVAVAPEGV